MEHFYLNFICMKFYWNLFSQKKSCKLSRIKSSVQEAVPVVMIARVKKTYLQPVLNDEYAQIHYEDG